VPWRVPANFVGAEPEAAPLEQPGLDWRNTCGRGNGHDTLTSGLEGAWTDHPTRWNNADLDHLFRYDWELTTSPAGAKQYRPTNPEAQDTVPDAHDRSKRHAPIMLTTDLALKLDPIYGPISRRFREHPDPLPNRSPAARSIPTPGSHPACGWLPVYWDSTAV
jgi:catalase-peroxidase